MTRPTNMLRTPSHAVSPVDPSRVTWSREAFGDRRSAGRPHRAGPRPEGGAVLRARRDQVAGGKVPRRHQHRG